MGHRQEQNRMYSGGDIGMRSCGLVSRRMTKSSPLFRKNKTFTLWMHETGHCSSHPELKPSTVAFQRTRDSFQPKANSGSGIMAHDLEVPTCKIGNSWYRMRDWNPDGKPKCCGTDSPRSYGTDSSRSYDEGVKVEGKLMIVASKCW